MVSLWSLSVFMLLAFVPEVNQRESKMTNLTDSMVALRELKLVSNGI